MILTKEEIDKIKKKIVIELTFDYSMTSPDVECKYQLFYDDGQGLKSDKLDIKTLEFAKKIKEKNYEKFKDFFSLSPEEYIHSENKYFKIFITDEIEKNKFFKTLYNFGVDNLEPIFIKGGKDYYFLNKITISKKNESIEECNIRELEKFISKKAFGKLYEHHQLIKEINYRSIY